MGPTWGPRGLQNREKSMKKGIISWTLFSIDFLLILGASWVGFWWILGAKLRAKFTKKLISTGSSEESDFLIFAEAKTLQFGF